MNDRYMPGDGGENSSPSHPVCFAKSEDDSRKLRGYYYYGNDTALVETHYGHHLLVDLKDISVTPTLIKTGWWEPWIDILLRSRLSEGMSYVNAGANYGYHTVLGASLVRESGIAVGIEANPFVYGLLKKTILINGFAQRTLLYNIAINDLMGDIEFRYVREQLGGGGIVVPRKRVGPINPTVENYAEVWGRYPVADSIRITARGVTLDQTVGRQIEKLDVLHMDIEQSEGAALLGARELIARSPSIHIIFEWAKPHSLSEDRHAKMQLALEFLHQERFSFFAIMPPDGNVYSMPPSLMRVDPADLFEREDIDNLFLTRG